MNRKKMRPKLNYIYEEIPRNNYVFILSVEDALALYSHSGFICYGKYVYNTSARLVKYRIQNLFFYSWNLLQISRGVHRVKFFLSFNNCAGTEPPATLDDLDSKLAIYKTNFVIL